MDKELLITAGIAGLGLLLKKKKPEFVSSTSGKVLGRSASQDMSPGNINTDVIPSKAVQPDLVMPVTNQYNEVIPGDGQDLGDPDADSVGDPTGFGSSIGLGTLGSIAHGLVSVANSLSMGLFGNVAKGMHKGIDKGLNSMQAHEAQQQAQQALSGATGGGGSPGNAGTGMGSGDSSGIGGMGGTAGGDYGGY